MSNPESRQLRDVVRMGTVASRIAVWTLLLPAFMLLVLGPFERTRISEA